MPEKSENQTPHNRFFLSAPVESPGGRPSTSATVVVDRHVLNMARQATSAVSKIPGDMHKLAGVSLTMVGSIEDLPDMQLFGAAITAAVRARQQRRDTNRTGGVLSGHIKKQSNTKSAKGASGAAGSGRVAEIAEVDVTLQKQSKGNKYDVKASFTHSQQMYQQLIRGSQTECRQLISLFPEGSDTIVVKMKFQIPKRSAGQALPKAVFVGFAK